jgi:hypothetical protein
MSKQKAIKLIFEDKEKTIPGPQTLKEFVIEFQKSFSINNEVAKKLMLFYLDDEGDKVYLECDSDYELFVEDEDINKAIKGEIHDKIEDSMSCKIIDENKPFDNSSFLENSVSSFDFNNEINNNKKSNKQIDEISKLNQMIKKKIRRG